MALETVTYTAAVQLPAAENGKSTFPLSLSPSSLELSLENILAETNELSRSRTLHKLLDQHGAIYFQNLGLEDADEFSRFAHSFDWTAHEDIGNPVRRTVHAKNVATANEGPNTQPVYPHNEFGLSPHYPAYVLFFCLSAPETGGETPINDSTLLYRRLVERHPEFTQQLEEKGVKYQLFYPNGPKDQVDSAGTTVRQSYGLHIKDSDDTETARAKVEREVQRLPTATWEWENQTAENPLGDLRVWQVLPAIREHPRNGQKAFFNNIVSRFLNAVDNDTLEPPHKTKEGRYQPPAFYGDGSLIPAEYLRSAVEIINDTRALVSWTPGDVLLIDNHAVQHARQPWTGHRKLLASLWDEPVKETVARL